MKPKLFSSALSVRRSAIQGYGVFAEQNIKPGGIIEECRTIMIDNEALRDELTDYCFEGENNNRLIVLGCGFIYNHSQRPNAVYRFDNQSSLMVFRATTRIRKGEEIFITYGDNWFSGRDLEPLELSWRIKPRAFRRLLRTVSRFAFVTGILVGVLMYAHA